MCCWNGWLRMADCAAGQVQRLDTDAVNEDHWAWACGLCNTEGTTYYQDGAWANLVNHVRMNHMTELARACPGCRTDGSNAMGLQGHLPECIYNPMRIDIR